MTDCEGTAARLSSELVPQIDNLQDLVVELRRVFDADKVDIDYVKTVLSAYKSNPKDWAQFAHFDQYRYTRNLVDTGNGKYNLIALCWGEGHGSSVHDHSDAHCFVKVLDGTLKETMFDWPSPPGGGTISENDECATAADVSHEHDDHDGLVQTAVHTYDKDGVTYINDTMGLHRIENPSHSDPAVSLHLYIPPFDFCRTFDQRTGKSRRVQMVYWSKYGQRDPHGNKKVNSCSQIVLTIPANTSTTELAST
jgi:cysteine dioxygenase